MMISESGFQEFPYIVPRFLKATGETMGRSPAMTALPDVKMLNLMSKTIIQAAQKQIDPPFLFLMMDSSCPSERSLGIEFL